MKSYKVECGFFFSLIVGIIAIIIASLIGSVPLSIFGLVNVMFGIKIVEEK